MFLLMLFSCAKSSNIKENVKRDKETLNCLAGNDVRSRVEKWNSAYKRGIENKYELKHLYEVVLELKKYIDSKHIGSDNLNNNIFDRSNIMLDQDVFDRANIINEAISISKEEEDMLNRGLAFSNIIDEVSRLSRQASRRAAKSEEKDSGPKIEILDEEDTVKEEQTSEEEEKEENIE